MNIKCPNCANLVSLSLPDPNYNLSQTYAVCPECDFQVRLTVIVTAHRQYPERR